ncbi:hypothetical protein [Amphibiibacter pelophylacis]|uniref:Uncharacterized protein n=1 Tax=Amphibiibacter pelophylacis TaxID=1799477 RepID=A0ACC6NZQ9_9BURK
MNKLHSLRLIKVDDMFKQLFAPFIIFMGGICIIFYFGKIFELPNILIMLFALMLHFLINAFFKPYQPLYIRIYKGTREGDVEAVISYKEIKIKGVVVESSFENNSLQIRTDGHKKSGNILVPSSELGAELSKYISEVPRNLENFEPNSISEYLNGTDFKLEKVSNNEGYSIIQIYNVRHFMSLKFLLILTSTIYFIWLLSRI